MMTGRMINIILGGGGVKGVAHVGALAASMDQGFRWNCIGGVSAGAVVAALAAAGYGAVEMARMLEEFEFQKMVQNENRTDQFPLRRVIEQYILNESGRKAEGNFDIDRFVAHALVNSSLLEGPERNEILKYDYRGSILHSLVNIVKDGGIYDGEYLENWLRGKLAFAGIRNFGDLKFSMGDQYDYRLKVTATDATLGKVLTLPEDIEAYGMNPDSLDVARAVRMSTSIPYFFKPVKLEYISGGKKKVSNIVDGGLLNKFPSKLFADQKNSIHDFAFVLSGKSQGRIDVNYPINTVKGIISFLWNKAGQQSYEGLSGVVEIDTSMVSWIDFDLSKKEMQLLLRSGYIAGMQLFEKYKQSARLYHG